MVRLSRRIVILRKYEETVKFDIRTGFLFIGQTVDVK